MCSPFKPAAHEVGIWGTEVYLNLRFLSYLSLILQKINCSNKLYIFHVRKNTITYIYFTWFFLNSKNKKLNCLIC